MKLISVILCSLFTLVAHAQVSETVIQCTRTEETTCLDRTVSAFEKLGCEPLAQSVQCRDAATDPNVDPSEINNLRGKDLCFVQSNCHSPHYGNFGQVSCNWVKPGEQTLDLRDVDAGITLTTAVGLFRQYVTTLCK